MPEPFAGPVPQIGYRLPSGRAIQVPAQVMGADNAHHLNVNHVRRHLVDIDG